MHDLLARYARLIDDRKLDSCAALFSDDAVLVVNGDTRTGRPSIRAWMAEIGRNSGGRHLITNTVLEVAGSDSAEGVSDFAYLRRNGEGTWELTAVGRYRDEMARVDDAWYFTRRTIDID